MMEDQTEILNFQLIECVENQTDWNKSIIERRKQYWEENSGASLEVKTERKHSQASLEDGHIPDMKDIYDRIHGNVQNKLTFYEGKRKSIEEPIKREILIDDQEETDNIFEDVANINQHVVMNSENDTTCDGVNVLQDIAVKNLENEPKILEDVVNSGNKCKKCQQFEFNNHRSEVLTEINANLKLELESVKSYLKMEMSKNNQLNFEIANMETSLEKYYKEAKQQKSTFATIYSTMKNYVSEQKSDRNYTFERIKMIAEYIESIKNKLEQQDRIITNDFIENPHYTNLVIKHDAVLQQLNDISLANQRLIEEMEKKSLEELEVIKHLNQQKFQMENKCQEMENEFRKEISNKEKMINIIDERCEKQLEDCKAILREKDEEIEKIERIANARIHNYKQELLIVYRKWKDQKMH